MLYHNTYIHLMTILNEKPRRFSSKEKSWRMRKDLIEVLNNTEEPACFSASMARKYASLYIFAMYFESRNEKVWINSVLALFGWKEGYKKNPYRMAVYNMIRSLRADFNIEIELVKAKDFERCGKGQSYYVIKDVGLFNTTPLFKMLFLNREVFEKIIHEDFINTIKAPKMNNDEKE